MSDFERFDQRKGKSNYDDSEDIDDFTFLNHPKHGDSGYLLGGDNYRSNQHSNSRQLQISDEVRRIEERTIQSSERSIGLLYDSENMGVAAAEELIRQREQLQNAEIKLDDTNRTLRTTQKHINSIKSVFGGIKNYFSKTPNQPKLGPSNVSPPAPRSSKLESVMDNSKNECSAKNFSHPNLRSRGLDSPEGDDDYETTNDREFLHAPNSKTKFRNSSPSRYQDFQSRIDKNLGEMSSGISRLKGLASELGNEIDDQNVLIDRVGDKVDKANIGIEKQNKEMRQILK